MTAPTETTTSPTWRAVTTILAAQRAAVLAVIEGLDETALHTPVVPSGWTPIGLVEHLGRAETLWFQHAVAGGPVDGPRQEGPEPSPFVTDRPSAEVVAFYRRACVRAEEILAGVGPSDPPKGWLPPDLMPFADDVATICVHMIEETARHLGHLDLARELLDGRTGLGPR